MGVTQYIGARYVPLFADPAEWTKARTYEPLTIVLHEGNSYTSKQFVPVGIDINETAFWAETGNYNAQVEAYRQEVLEAMRKIGSVAGQYKTVKDMTEDENLEVGKIVNTLGFHHPGDAGKASYLITNNKNYNEYDKIRLNNNLCAELVLTNSYVVPEQLGAYGNLENDDSKVIQYALDNYSVKGFGNYVIANTININKSCYFKYLKYTGNKNGVIITGDNLVIEIDEIISSTTPDYVVKIIDCSDCVFNLYNIRTTTGSGLFITDGEENTTNYSTLIEHLMLNLNRIYANKNGITFYAKNYGVLDSELNSTFIHALNNDALQFIVSQNNDSPNKAFIGNINIMSGRYQADNGRAVFIEVQKSNKANEISAINFLPISCELSQTFFELDCASGSGSFIEGVQTDKTRSIEKPKEYLVKASGELRSCIFDFDQRVSLDQIEMNIASVSYARHSTIKAPTIIDSSTRYTHLYERIEYAMGKTFPILNYHYQGTIQTDWEFELGVSQPLSVIRVSDNAPSAPTITIPPYVNPFSSMDFIVICSPNNELGAIIKNPYSGNTKTTKELAGSSNKRVFRIFAISDSSRGDLFEYKIQPIEWIGNLA